MKAWLSLAKSQHLLMKQEAGSSMAPTLTGLLEVAKVTETKDSLQKYRAPSRSEK